MFCFPVEDPSEEFVALRDVTDCKYLIESCPQLFKSAEDKELNCLSKDLIEECIRQTKLNKVVFIKLSRNLDYWCKM